ncbi:MAG: dodecin domain-containing protein [Gammaproteobacteria bacterium]|nr:dodecin domain-containing protein [Gammaproteobacteria bacterium]
MSDHVYKTIHITGSSKDGIQPAIETAIAKASESLRHLRWFEVTEIRGELDGNAVSHWQVSMKLGFTLQDNAGA